MTIRARAKWLAEQIWDYDRPAMTEPGQLAACLEIAFREAAVEILEEMLTRQTEGLERQKRRRTF